MSRNFELMTQLGLRVVETDEPGPVLAGPAVVMPVASSVTGNAFREETLRLVQRVFLSANNSAPRQIVFCGVEGENGSGSVCACAGRTFAAISSQSVCLVDANIRSRRLSDIFGLNMMTPFSATSDSLRGQCLKIGGNLWLAGASILSDDSRALLSLDELKKRLGQLRETFAYMLIDAPGTSVCGDAQLLGQVADAAILVIEANNTRRLTARKAMESLDAAGVRLLGTVLHNRSFPIPAALYKRL